jgi:Ca-activated chloride channel family protein
MAVSRRNRLALVGALLVSCSALALAQQPTFRAGTQVVSLFATVTDTQKRLVPDLMQSDFEVFDNEKPQPLVFFQNQVQPISVVVMLDTSGSMTLTLDLLRAAAEQFVLRLLPADKARVGAFNDKIQFMGRTFMNDRDQLVTDIKNLDYGNGTRLWDACAASLDELKAVEGRKIILVFTDGDDTESHNSSLGKVIDRARVEEVMIYAIGLESRYVDPNTGRPIRTRPDSGLRKIADETGGGYFELTRASELSSTFTRVAQELHSQYVLGFTPMMLDGKVHKLAVRMKQPGMTARARRSYLASADKSAQ